MFFQLNNINNEYVILSLSCRHSILKITQFYSFKNLFCLATTFRAVTVGLHSAFVSLSRSGLVPRPIILAVFPWKHFNRRLIFFNSEMGTHQ